MTLLNPAGLLALGLAVPILVLYFLRLHRREARVPSLLLWEAVRVDRRANRPWQKFRRHWLLFLQLLALLALALTLARPAWPAPEALRGQAVILLDVSASMQARQGETTRLEVALRRLRDLAGTLGSTDRVTLIAVGPEPRVLLQEGDAAALRRALETVTPTTGPADWTMAAALAAGLARGEQVTTWLVTDAAGAMVIPALPGEVQLLGVGDEAANAGLVALALRRAPAGLTAFVRVRNAGPAMQRTLALYADGRWVTEQTVTLPADGEVTLSFSGFPALRAAEARLAGTDALALDDRATVSLAAPAGGRVLVATPGNRFLVQAVRVLPGLQVAQAADLAPALTLTATTAYDLLIVDGPVTGTAALGERGAASGPGLWFLAPPPGTPCGEPAGVFTATAPVRGRWSDARLAYVTWDDVTVAQATRYTPPADATVLLEAPGGPLLWVLERPQQRIACLAFALQDSDLPLRLAFPILAANLTGWLLPSAAVEPVVAVPGAGGLLDETETDLRPQPVLVGGRPLTAKPVAEPGWREFSRWPLALALLLVLLEAVAWWGAEWRVWLKRETGSVKRETGNVRREASNVKREAGNGKREAGSGKRETGSVKRETSNGKREAGSVRGIGAGAWRVGLVALLVAALAGWEWRRPTRDLAVVFLLDRSASITPSAWEQAVAFVQEALAHKAPGDRAGVVVFGAQPWVERGLSTASTLAEIATFPLAEATDVEAAVRLGLALIPSEAPGRLVLLTDGLETTGEAERALREARARAVDLVVVGLGGGAAPAETWLADLRVPAQAYPGDQVPVAVTVGTNRAQPVLLTWTAGRQSGQQALALAETGGTLALTLAAQEPGFLPVRVCLTAAADTFVQNNCADGWVLVQGPPQVLVLGAGDERAALVTALRRAGLSVVEAEPAAAPRTVEALASYAAVVVVDTPARALSTQALEALRAFVRDLGGGLVAVGGPQSYGVGGWLGTPLEEALPVTMQVRDPERFPPLAMAVVIDKSGSMGVEEGGLPKIRLAAEAAARVAEALNDADTLAVIAYDDRPATTLGPVTLDQRDELLVRLRRLQAGGGGIYVRESLAYAADLLRSAVTAPQQQRHILLLADGSDAEHQEGVIPQVTALRAEGFTVSVVSIGSGSDVPFLQQVAQVGAGRFYLTEYAADLPAIFAEEALQAKRSYIVEELFYPALATSWEPVATFATTPPLRGYVAATPKPAAQVVWEATRGDPLLAAWQFGLGRAVAWTADATGRWAAGWVAWDEFARFWGNLVRWTFPAPATAGVTLRVIPEGRMARLVVEAVQPDGAFADGLRLQVHASRPGEQNSAQEVTLRQSAPGRYEGRLVLSGAESWLLRLTGDRTLTAGWASLPPAEYLPGDGPTAVARLLAVGGGHTVDNPAAIFAHDRRGRATGQPLAPLLTLLATLLWPVDIAWRRLGLTWALVAAALPRWGRALSERWRRFRLQHRSRPAAAPAPPTLAATLRRRRTPPQPGPATLPPAPPAEPAGPSVVPTPTVPPPPAASPEPSPDESLASRLKKRVRS